MERDEYQLHAFPVHTLAQYAEAHALAGDLALVPEDQPQVQREREQLATLERIARGVKE